MRENFVSRVCQKRREIYIFKLTHYSVDKRKSRFPVFPGLQMSLIFVPRDVNTNRISLDFGVIWVINGHGVEIIPPNKLAVYSGIGWYLSFDYFVV